MAATADDFCRWLEAQGAAPVALPLFRSGALRLIEVARGGPVTGEHLEALLAERRSSGAPATEIRDLQKIGAAYLRFQAEAGTRHPASPAAAMPPRPSSAPSAVSEPPLPPLGFKVLDPRVIGSGPSWQSRHPAFRARNLGLGVAGALLLAWASLWLFQRTAMGRRDAIIEHVSAYHAVTNRGAFGRPARVSPAADVLVVFRSPPGDGDARDVKLTFSSVALETNHVVDWRFLAPRARRDGAAAVAPLSPEEPPPLDVPLEFTVTLPMKKEVQALRTDLLLTATLEWGGVRQDRHKVSLGPFFDKK